MVIFHSYVSLPEGTDSGTNTEKHDKIVIAGIVIVIFKKNDNNKKQNIKPHQFTMFR